MNFDALETSRTQRTLTGGAQLLLPLHLDGPLFVALCLAGGYALLGATWLLMKMEGPLVRQAAGWGWWALWVTGLGIAAVSIATPYVSPRIFEK